MVDPTGPGYGSDSTPSVEPGKLLTGSFAFICTAHFLAYACNLMVDPVLSLYLVSQGWPTSLIGIAFAAFSVTSFLTRPLIGRAVDVWSARGTFLVGALALSLPSFIYLLPSAGLLLCARVVHGLGWGCINTAGASLTTDAAPARRRGEALGYYSMMPSLAATVAPAFSFWLIGTAGFQSVFVIAGSLSAIAAVTVSLVRERPRPAHQASSGGFWSSLVEPAVLVPAALNILFMLAQAITVIYISLYARSRGIDDLSRFFLATGLTQLIVGLLAKFSDRWGRGPIIAVAFAFALAGMWWLMQATNLMQLVLGGIVFSLGFGLVAPTLIALAVDMAPPGRRGAGLATFTASYQMGYAAAALIWGYVIELAGFEGMFLGAFLALGMGLAVLAARWRSVGSSQPVAARGEGS